VRGFPGGVEIPRSAHARGAGAESREENWRPRAEKEHEKAGIEPRELAELGRGIVETLRGRALGTDAIRKALPETAVRSLGEKGKKLGLSSTLSAGAAHARVRGPHRTHARGGRLDSERYCGGSPRATFLPAPRSAAPLPSGT